MSPTDERPTYRRRYDPMHVPEVQYTQQYREFPADTRARRALSPARSPRAFESRLGAPSNPTAWDDGYFNQQLAYPPYPSAAPRDNYAALPAQYGVPAAYDSRPSNAIDDYSPQNERYRRPSGLSDPVPQSFAAQGSSGNRPHAQQYDRPQEDTRSTLLERMTDSHQSNHGAAGSRSERPRSPPPRTVQRPQRGGAHRGRGQGVQRGGRQQRPLQERISSINGKQLTGGGGLEARLS